MDIHIVRVELPDKVHGFVTKADEYKIYINTNDPFYERVKTLLHETGHIALEHFESDKPFWLIEKEAREYADLIHTFSTFINDAAYKTWERFSSMVSLDILMRCAAIINIH